ncbi:protein TOPAZ1 [Protopterus annectens]|uniref:protein TOPAZ1 n=1 Tax=Protopterus annectens TaxID=7888 RepID=UPI001CFA6819|nr:protein TOPAZ1 [Protopterus annectens]
MPRDSLTTEPADVSTLDGSRAAVQALASESVCAYSVICHELACTGTNTHAIPCNTFGRPCVTKDPRATFHQPRLSRSAYRPMNFSPGKYVRLPSCESRPVFPGVSCAQQIPDFRSASKWPWPHMDLQTPKMDNFMQTNIGGENSLLYQCVDQTPLPFGYCKFYFNTFRGCVKPHCWFEHVPKPGDEKLCMEVIRKFVNSRCQNLVIRAVNIFGAFYKNGLPGADFSMQVLNDLLFALIMMNCLNPFFNLLNLSLKIKVLPQLDILLNAFEHVSSGGVKSMVPILIEILCKCVEMGMTLHFKHCDYIIKHLEQMHASNEDIDIIQALKTRQWTKPGSGPCDLNMAVAEVEHYKEKQDWEKMGMLYTNMRTCCENLGELHKLSRCMTSALKKDRKDDHAIIPFCQFAKAVWKDTCINGVDKKIIGKIGVSLMCTYYKNKEWIKGRKVLDTLRELHICFKALTCDVNVSRCQLINMAVEIYMETGYLDGAVSVLKESDWMISNPLCPCDAMDVINRHNLLCTVAAETMERRLYKETLEILKHLPGLQEEEDSSEAFKASQYNMIFNELLRVCIENNILGVSSSTVDFMTSKNISVNFVFLRKLVTALGKTCLWCTARNIYKKALLMGCYPPMKNSLYHRILPVPHFMSETEQKLALEVFLVYNASSIQNPASSSPTLQIVVKRHSENAPCTNEEYQAGVKRLHLASRLSEPKLLIKYTTVNFAEEQVYILEHCSALKWLNQNMRWAGKIWLFPPNASF